MNVGLALSFNVVLRIERIEMGEKETQSLSPFRNTCQTLGFKACAQDKESKVRAVGIFPNNREMMYETEDADTFPERRIQDPRKRDVRPLDDI